MTTAPWTEAIAEDPTIVSGALLALAAAPLSSSARMLMTIRTPGQKTMLLGVEPEGYVEDEDDAAALYDLGPSGELIARGCPTCSSPVRRTVGMICPACGKDYGPPTFGDLVDTVAAYIYARHTENLHAEWEALDGDSRAPWLGTAEYIVRAAVDAATEMHR